MFLVYFFKNQDIDYIAVKVVDSTPRPGALLVVREEKAKFFLKKTVLIRKQ